MFRMDYDVICYIVNCISYIHGFEKSSMAFYIALAQTHFEDWLIFEMKSLFS